MSAQIFVTICMHVSYNHYYDHCCNQVDDLTHSGCVTTLHCLYSNKNVEQSLSYMVSSLLKVQVEQSCIKEIESFISWKLRVYTVQTQYNITQHNHLLIILL